MYASSEKLLVPFAVAVQCFISLFLLYFPRVGLSSLSRISRSLKSLEDVVSLFFLALSQTCFSIDITNNKINRF